MPESRRKLPLGLPLAAARSIILTLHSLILREVTMKAEELRLEEVVRFSKGVMDLHYAAS